MLQVNFCDGFSDNSLFEMIHVSTENLRKIIVISLNFAGTFNHGNIHLIADLAHVCAENEMATFIVQIFEQHIAEMRKKIENAETI